MLFLFSEFCRLQ